MTRLNKAVLLLLSFVMLYSILGCSSGTFLIPPNGFLYASNSFRPGSMSAFTVTTGALAPIFGSPFTTSPNAPYTLTLASNKFLYAGIPKTGGAINRILNRPVAGSVAGGILLMPITGGVPGIPQPQTAASGGDYDPMAVTPKGNFLYAADITANLLAAFSIDSSKGTLTAISPAGPPPGVPVGPDPFNVVVDPQGKFVFVANCDCTAPSNNGSVSVFLIDPNNGTLSAVGKFPIGGGAAHPSALAISSDNAFLFIASLDDKVYVESITNGVLADLGSVSLPAGSTPDSIALSIDGGNSVYTGNAGTQTLSFFLNCTQTTLPVVATGSTPCPADRSVPLVLQATGGAIVGGVIGVILPDPTTTPASTVGTITTPATGPGHFLYVTDYDHGTVVVFFVTSTNTCTTTSGTTTCPITPGTLTQSGFPANTGGTNPFGLAFVPL